MENLSFLIAKVKTGFKNLNVDSKYKDKALIQLKRWLSEDQFEDYQDQIKYWIKKEKWDLILDSFYQVIPFGTGGRRGLVGIGPNRINPWTIQSSAQGHSQYLIERFGKSAKKRGIVISYDVRQYLKTEDYDASLPNPVRDLTCKDLAIQAACVYAANGIRIMLFKNFTSTPEMSFMVRHLKAVSGVMISASHNPPEFNGKKVVDETGGQLIPPFDEELVTIVSDKVKKIKQIDCKKAEKQGLITYISQDNHEAYLKAALKTSINEYRSAKILFSPFHGTALFSVYEVLKRGKFDVILDKKSGIPDPRFSSIKFNIPNPEVAQAYENLVPEADKIKADVIMTADPDADRIGLMSKEKNGWYLFNGNEIMILSVSYMLSELKKNKKLKSSNVIIKTLVTTNFLNVLAKEYKIKIIGDLLVGIKYIADEMNKLQKKRKIDDFLIGGEESHGMVAGNYIRDKDTCVPAILIAELASKLKDEGKTLRQYLDSLFIEFGYYRNFLTEIRLPGAEGMDNIAKIQKGLRKNKPKKIGNFEVISFDDKWEGKPFLSETDKVARNVIVMKLKTDDAKTVEIIATVRPSGTEPKTKIYLEIGRKPIKDGDFEKEKKEVEKMKERVEKDVVKYCYKLLGIDFPDRGFLLFWQLPVQDKMKYFEIEPEIEKLKKVKNKKERQEKLEKLLGFLGSSPIDKCDEAFKAKNKMGVKKYLGL